MDVMQQGYRAGLLKQKRFNGSMGQQTSAKQELALCQDGGMGQNR